MCCFGLKTGVQFAHFDLESGRYSFRRNHGEECMYLLFQFQMIRKEREMCEFERYFKKFFQKVESLIHRLNLYPVDTGVENDRFLSEMGP